MRKTAFMYRHYDDNLCVIFLLFFLLISTEIISL
nr:MAG TPA: hypothetical protein [Caudoviricetes sp.]